MKTKAFETLIQSALKPLSNNWPQELSHKYPQFIPYKVRHHCEHLDGRIYKKIVNFELRLHDETLLLTICQDDKKLVFFYFGVTTCESATEDLLSLLQDCTVTDCKI